ncbi:MAG: hypothetical protein ACLQF1_07215 [Methyloceanibacter sp.]
MNLSIKEITISSPRERTPKGFGWSGVFIHLEDRDLEVMPSLTVNVHVPYSEDDTFRAVRERALERAKAIIQFALGALEKTDLRAIDAAIQGSVSVQSLTTSSGENGDGPGG